MIDKIACKTGRKGTEHGRLTRLAEHGISKPKSAGRFKDSVGPQASKDGEEDVRYQEHVSSAFTVFPL